MTTRRIRSIPNIRDAYRWFFYDRQFKREFGSSAGSFAKDSQRSAQLFGGKRTAMKAKTVTLFSGRKAMTEDPIHIFLWNANAIVNNGNFHPVILLSDAQCDLFVVSVCITKGLHGIANEIDQDLQDPVLIHRNGLTFGIFPEHFDPTGL